jgi:hypothetical protein
MAEHKAFLKMHPGLNMNDSTVKVKFIESRPYIPVKLGGSPTEIMALYDLGASSCSIKKSLLNEIEAFQPVSRVPYPFTVSGFMPDMKTIGSEVALVDLRIGPSGYTLEKIPMIILENDSNYNLIIGNNIVRSQKWNSYWKDEGFFIDLNDQKHAQPIKASFLSDSSLSAVTMMTYTLQPTQSVMAELTVPSLYGLAMTNFHKKTFY